MRYPEELQEKVKLAFDNERIEQIDAQRLRRIQVMEKLMKFYIGMGRCPELRSIGFQNVGVAVRHRQDMRLGDCLPAVVKYAIFVDRQNTLFILRQVFASYPAKGHGSVADLRRLPAAVDLQ